MAEEAKTASESRTAFMMMVGDVWCVSVRDVGFSGKACVRKTKMREQFDLVAVSVQC